MHSGAHARMSSVDSSTLYSLQRCPQAYFACMSLAEPISVCATHALRIDHVDVMRAVNKYFVEARVTVRLLLTDCLSCRCSSMCAVQSGVVK